MNNINVLAIDIAKTVFELCGVTQSGKTVLKKQLKRNKLLEYTSNLPSCIIAMEACGGSNYWARCFKKQGHQVKLISPQFVKPFVRGNKNDKNDAQAIAMAAQQPSIPQVEIKEIWQQDIQSIHRMRSRLIAQRTALVNQIRGLLAEYGVVIKKGVNSVRSELPFILEDAENELTFLTRDIFQKLYEELGTLDKSIDWYDQKIETIFKHNELAQRLEKIPGIGKLGATAILCVLRDTSVFKNGRHFAAFLGLVPKQYSSGGRQKLLGISKRGDRYIRVLLIHGARAVIRFVEKRTDSKSQWIKKLISTRGKNKAAVALANKNARIIWALLAYGEPYRAEHCVAQGAISC